MKEYKSKEKNHFARRADEARKHREMIISGKASKQCLVGMTTFYSLPTRSQDGAQGVEDLFGDAVDKLAIMETQRILSYPFSKDAVLVFTQKSTCEHFCTITGTEPIYWPMNEWSPRSSGEYLRELLDKYCT